MSDNDYMNQLQLEYFRNKLLQLEQEILENAKKTAPYDSSLQLTFPIAGEKNKFVTGRIDLRDRGGVELANKILSMLENQQHFCYNPKNSKLLELNNSNSPQAKTLNLFSESNEAKEKYENGKKFLLYIEFNIKKNFMMKPCRQKALNWHTFARCAALISVR